MKFFWHLLLLPALLLVGLASANAQAPVFDRAIVCGAGDGDYRWGPQAFVSDAQGNTYVAGVFNGTIQLGNTILVATQTYPGRTMPSDNFVAKLDPNGNYVWAVQLGDNQSARISALAVDGAGNVYVTGGFDSFSLRFGVNGPVLFNSSAQGDVFVAKLDGTTRQWLWARRAGGTAFDTGHSIALNAAGEVYVLGFSNSATADFGPFIVTTPPTSSYNSFLAKLSPAGTVGPVGGR